MSGIATVRAITAVRRMRPAQSRVSGKKSRIRQGGTARKAPMSGSVKSMGNKPKDRDPYAETWNQETRMLRPPTPAPMAAPIVPATMN
jgi:hypothetical protein